MDDSTQWMELDESRDMMEDIQEYMEAKNDR